ncbi:helix-turn-helix domain-containing protein [Candidatus Dependentiae bacterium]
MTKKIKTTYDIFVKSLSPKEKEEFEKEYKELVLSELLIALMEEDNISVRKLAKEAGISPTVIQGIRSGTKKNITMLNFLKILKILGCSLIAEKGENRIAIDISAFENRA